ncbi:MAG: hypothetical protein QHJ73_20025, partial [Armatimonadota bacterium]|nr:hypothetical protein [Armatimonadota bacterium]
MGKNSILKWLYPGMRVKRWLLLAALGVLLMTLGGLGVALVANMKVFDLLGEVNNFTRLHTGRPVTAVVVPAGIGAVGLGMLCLALGIGGMVRSITSVLKPDSHQRLADVIYRTRYLQQGARVVVVGGGTGLSTML